MAKKSRSKIGKIVFELTTSGVFVLGLLYFGGYYIINGNLPECVMNFNVWIPVSLFGLSSIGGNISAIINKLRRFV